MSNNKIPMIFPFEIKYVMMTLSEALQYGHRIHNIPEAWKETKGEGITTCIIDTGLPVHRDLDGQILDAANFTDSPLEDKVVGHSTLVAGIIAAKENNEGVIGIAPKQKLFIAKALGDDGSGSDEWLANAIYWAIDKKADIINMSLGAPATYEFAFKKTQKAVQKAYEAGIVLIAAAGNESASKVGIPARFPQVISVAAIDSKKEKAEFSNRGPRLDFAACGVNILSTYKNNLYSKMSGTSFSAPQISGIAALILASHRKTPGSTPINNPDNLREHIRKISIDLGEKGHDVYFGDGLPVFGKIYQEDPQVPPPNICPPKECWLKKLFNYLKGLF